MPPDCSRLTDGRSRRTFFVNLGSRRHAQNVHHFAGARSSVDQSVLKMSSHRGRNWGAPVFDIVPEMLGISTVLEPAPTAARPPTRRRLLSATIISTKEAGASPMTPHVCSCPTDNAGANTLPQKIAKTTHTLKHPKRAKETGIEIITGKNRGENRGENRGDIHIVKSRVA
jgi:hypothetical protein